VTLEAISAVKATVKKNSCAAVNDKATHLDMSCGSAHHMVHDFLPFLKYLINI
jgi:hypothetical protein